MLKKCHTCSIVKEASAFGKDKQRPDGLQYHCISCRLTYRATRKKIITKQKKESYERTKDKVSENKKKYYEANKEKILVARKAFYAKNKEKLLAKNKNFYYKNPDWYKEYRYRSDGRVQAKEAKRRASKLQRTPSWLTDDDFWVFQQAHDLALLREKMFGFKWHVDHIVPLQGTNVSGLHVPENIQVIPASINTAKQNKFMV